MEFTAENIKAAGGIRHLCYYWDSIGGEPKHVPALRDYIEREWRGISPEEVGILLRMCTEARFDAQQCNLEVPS